MNKRILSIALSLILMLGVVFGTTPLTAVASEGGAPISVLNVNYPVDITSGAFPDANFQNYIRTNISTDDELTETEALAVTDIDVHSSSISSLVGVEYFPELLSINCRFNTLISLDLSNNTELRNLLCNDNQLSSLDVSSNTELRSLYCWNNQLGSLDLSNNTKLMELTCFNNQLGSLDLSNNTELIYLYCSDNQLGTLDVSNNTELRELNCHTNQLNSLDVSNNTSLTSLACSTNQLSSLDVSKNTALEGLHCDSNQLSSLDVSKNTALTTLSSQSNKLLFIKGAPSGVGTGTFNGGTQAVTIPVTNVGGHYESRGTYDELLGSTYAFSASGITYDTVSKKLIWAATPSGDIAFTTQTGIAGKTVSGDITATTDATLSFTDSATYDIPESTVGTAITPIDVYGGANGGTTPYAFSASGLPVGISIDAVTGVISGTPTAAGPAGTATITVTDSDTTVKNITINYGIIVPALAFADSAAYDIPASIVGTAITPIDVSGGANGGTVPYSFSASGLPAGIVISATGVISGTPTTAGSAGTATIAVTDSASVKREISIAYGVIVAKTVDSTDDSTKKDDSTPPAILPGANDPSNPNYYLPGGGGEVAIKAVKEVKVAVNTIYIQKGKTVSIPYVVYANKGYKGKVVSIVWTSSNPNIASVKLGSKIGTVKTGKLDANSIIKVKAGKKLGTATIVVKVDNNRTITFKVKVVAKDKKVTKFTLSKISKLSKGAYTLKKGKSTVIKVSNVTKDATGNVYTFTIAKKYQKYLVVDATGKLTALKAYKNGKSAIPVNVKVGTKTKTIKVRVK